jgi:N-acetylglucosaminyldiphosphoundecaprenol N-acetyl-beta-D-mannosaminyltransferase
MKKVECLGYQVYSDDLSNIQLVRDKSTIINTISPNSYGIATKDLRFSEALKNSDILVLDGVYFALGSILNKGKFIKKNQGPDMFKYFMEYYNKKVGKVFFLGSTNEVLKNIKKRAIFDYPNLSIQYFSPPFKTEFTPQDNKQMIKIINAFEPDIVFVGMTCPKQEKWAYEYGKSLKTEIVCSIGAVFNWYSGDQKEIHPYWWKFRLAWLKRTMDRPEILKRYPNIGIFFFHLFLSLLGIKMYENAR